MKDVEHAIAAAAIAASTLASASPQQQQQQQQAVPTLSAGVPETTSAPATPAGSSGPF